MSEPALPDLDPADPWLGCDPADPDYIDDPFPRLARLREIDPVSQTPLGGWRLTRHADVVRLLRDVPVGVRTRDGELLGVDESDFQSQRRFMLQQDPPNHTRLRKLVSKAFTPRAVQNMHEGAARVTAECLDAVAARAAGGRGEMDLIADLALPVPATVICEMMGVPVADRDRFTVWTSKATHGLAGDAAPPEVLRAAREAGLSLAEYFNALIADRRRHLGDDVISGLIRAQSEDADALDDAEMLSQCIGLLIAGFETTIGLIGNGARALMRHPDELARLREKPDLIETAVEECLRYDGPIVLTVRVVHEDVEFGGKVIPKDAPVHAMLAAANRDPAKFPEPDRFDVGRTPNEHVAFGGGAHICLGAHLARMETRLALGGLVQRFPRLELVSPDRVVWGPSLFRVPGTLPVAFGL